MSAPSVSGRVSTGVAAVESTANSAEDKAGRPADSAPCRPSGYNEGAHMTPPRLIVAPLVLLAGCAYEPPSLAAGVRFEGGTSDADTTEADGQWGDPGSGDSAQRSLDTNPDKADKAGATA